MATPDPRSLAEVVAALPLTEQLKFWGSFKPDERDWVAQHWLYRRRGDQFVDVAGDWSTWLVMAGRGYGKTRLGAEWVRARAATSPPGTRIAIVGATIAEARGVMVEGTSGVLNLGPVAERPEWSPSTGELRWPDGVVGRVYSAERPEALRGPEHGFAWCDEIAKWPYAAATWDNLRLGLRQGEQPRIVATTTPRPVPLVRRLLGEAGVRVTGGATAANSALPAAFVAEVTRLYGGTRLGRQELDGELIEEVADALWTRAGLERCRVGREHHQTGPLLAHADGASRPLPQAGEDYRRVVVGVDPPASSGGDACGVVAVGLRADGVAIVIEDASVEGAMPDGWARAVAGCAARTGADRVVAEANNGGAMIEAVLRAADARLPVKLVHASRGKAARAEPVAALYANGRVRHAGAFPLLEDELCGLTSQGYEGPGRSPDRADALVWAVTELLLGERRAEPRIRRV